MQSRRTESTLVPTHDWRIVRPHLIALHRKVANRTTVQAPRVGDDLRLFIKQSLRAFGLFSNGLELIGTAQFLGRDGCSQNNDR